MVERFQVGAVAGTHGLKGELKIFPMTDDPRRFKKGVALILDTGRGDLDLTVESARQQGRFVILRCQEITSIEEAERFRGKPLYVRREDAIPLREGEHYVADLIGMRVVDEEGTLLGTMTDVIETGANDVYAMDRADGSGEALFPAIAECVLSISEETRTITIHVMPGLF